MSAGLTPLLPHLTRCLPPPHPPPQFQAVDNNYYKPCAAGTYSYKLGALWSADGKADRCAPCFRGSASQQGERLLLGSPRPVQDSSLH
jgi:hypothetical protein